MARPSSPSTAIALASSLSASRRCRGPAPLRAPLLRHSALFLGKQTTSLNDSVSRSPAAGLSATPQRPLPTALKPPLPPSSPGPLAPTQQRFLESLRLGLVAVGKRLLDDCTLRLTWESGSGLSSTLEFLASSPHVCGNVFKTGWHRSLVSGHDPSNSSSPSGL